MSGAPNGSFLKTDPNYTALEQQRRSSIYDIQRFFFGVLNHAVIASEFKCDATLFMHEGIQELQIENESYSQL